MRQGRNKRTVTRRDVAEAAGVSTFAVSQALAGKSRVAAATRERVLRVAAELGYQPNAAASLLASQKKNRPTALRVVEVSPFVPDPSLLGEVCAKLGVTGEHIQPREFGSPAELLRVLYSRGVDGLFVSFDRWPWSAEETLKAEWEKFSVVKLNRDMEDLAFHLIRHDAFDYMHRTMQQVLGRGYRRVVALLPKSTPYETDDWARLGAVMAAAEHWPGRRISWRLVNLDSGKEYDAATLDWLRLQQPDAIVVFRRPDVLRLMKAGWRIPEDVAVSAVFTKEESIHGRVVSGNDIANHEMQEKGLGLLKTLIGRGERGLPDMPMEHVIEPRWIEGDTLPSRLRG